MDYKTINTEKLIGYKRLTPFYEMFSVYECAGAESIKAANNILLEFYKEDYKILVDLLITLNLKSLEHEKSNAEFAKFYQNLWDLVIHDYYMNFGKEEISYLFEIYNAIRSYQAEHFGNYM